MLPGEAHAGEAAAEEGHRDGRAARVRCLERRLEVLDPADRVRPRVEVCGGARLPHGAQLPQHRDDARGRGVRVVQHTEEERVEAAQAVAELGQLEDGRAGSLNRVEAADAQVAVVVDASCQAAWRPAGRRQQQLVGAQQQLGAVCKVVAHAQLERRRAVGKGVADGEAKELDALPEGVGFVPLDATPGQPRHVLSQPPDVGAALELARERHRPGRHRCRVEVGLERLQARCGGLPIELRLFGGGEAEQCLQALGPERRVVQHGEHCLARQRKVHEGVQVDADGRPHVLGQVGQ